MQLTDDSYSHKEQALKAFEDHVDTMISYAFHGYCLQHMKGGCRNECTKGMHFELDNACPFCGKLFTKDEPSHAHFGFHYRTVKRNVKGHLNMEPQEWFNMMVQEFEDRKRAHFDLFAQQQDCSSAAAAATSDEADEEGLDVVEVEVCATQITAKELAAAEVAVLIQLEEHTDTIFYYWINGYCLEHLQGCCDGCGCMKGKHFDVGEVCPFCGQVIEGFDPVWAHLGQHLNTEQCYVQEFSPVNPHFWFRSMVSEFEERARICVTYDKECATAMAIPNLNNDTESSLEFEEEEISSLCTPLDLFPPSDLDTISQQDLGECCQSETSLQTHQLAVVAKELCALKEKLLIEESKNKYLQEELKQVKSMLLDFQGVIGSLRLEVQSTRELLEEEKSLRSQEALGLQKRLSVLENIVLESGLNTPDPAQNSSSGFEDVTNALGYTLIIQAFLRETLERAAFQKTRQAALALQAMFHAVEDSNKAAKAISSSIPAPVSPAFNVDTLSIIPAKKNLKTTREGEAARNDDRKKKTKKHSGSRYADIIVAMDCGSDTTVASSSRTKAPESFTVADSTSFLTTDPVENCHDLLTIQAQTSRVASQDALIVKKIEDQEKRTLAKEDTASQQEELREVEMQCVTVLDSGDIKQFDNDSDRPEQVQEKKEDHEDVTGLKSMVRLLVGYCKSGKICSFFVQGKCKRGLSCYMRHVEAGACPIPGCFDSLNIAATAHLGYHLNAARRKAAERIGAEEAKKIIVDGFEPLKKIADAIKDRTCWVVPPPVPGTEAPRIANRVSQTPGIKDFFYVEPAHHLVVESNSQEEAAQVLEALKLMGFTPKEKHKSRSH